MSTARPFLVRTPRETVTLDRLTNMNPEELQQLYRAVFDSDVPSGNPEFARRKIAWHIQAEQEGGLPDSARQHAMAIAIGSKPRLRVKANAERRSQGLPLDHSVTTRIVCDHDSRLPMPGSLVIKKYKGQTIVVRVLKEGFEYDGRRFPSLTAVANEITGSKWNGFAFFGLARKGVRGS